MLLPLLFWQTIRVANAVDCAEIAKDYPLVNIRYNYGTLGFDNTKSSAQLKKVCGDFVAGCFANGAANYKLITSRQTIQSGTHTCIVPQITVDFDFSGTTIYVTKEYTSCQARAVLRHELQHFMIWKTATEEMLNETKKSLKEFALQHIINCSEQKNCNNDFYRDTWRRLLGITNKWNNVSVANNNRLDEVDHNNKTEFDYRVCAPYSLRFYQ